MTNGEKKGESDYAEGGTKAAELVVNPSPSNIAINHTDISAIHKLTESISLQFAYCDPVGLFRISQCLASCFLITKGSAPKKAE